MIYIKFRPNLVISTGAAPGVIGVVLGRLFLAKTIWVDSIANAEELSLGGKISVKIANDNIFGNGFFATQDPFAWNHYGRNIDNFGFILVIFLMIFCII